MFLYYTGPNLDKYGFDYIYKFALRAGAEIKISLLSVLDSTGAGTLHVEHYHIAHVAITNDKLSKFQSSESSTMSNIIKYL